MSKTKPKKKTISHAQYSREYIVEDLRKFLAKHTKCEIQDGLIDGKPEHWGWPCGTCFMDLLNRMGLDDTAPAYQDANKPRDRHNEVWRAILQIREPTTKKKK